MGGYLLCRSRFQGPGRNGSVCRAMRIRRPVGREKRKCLEVSAATAMDLNNGTNVFTILMRHYILETSNTPHCSMSIKLVMEITERIIYLTFPGWSNPRDQDVG